MLPIKRRAAFSFRSLAVKEVRFQCHVEQFLISIYSSDASAGARTRDGAQKIELRREYDANRK